MLQTQQPTIGFDALMEQLAQRTASIVLDNLKPLLEAMGRPAEDEKPLTKKQTMELLGLKNPTTLYKWATTKKLVPYGKIGGMTYYRREDVMAAIESKNKH